MWQFGGTYVPNVESVMPEIELDVVSNMETNMTNIEKTVIEKKMSSLHEGICTKKGPEKLEKKEAKKLM